MNRAKVGRAIKLARIKAGLTQAELADKLNVKQGTVGGWEIGSTCPKPANLLKLSTVLQVPIDSLMKGVA